MLKLKSQSIYFAVEDSLYLPNHWTKKKIFEASQKQITPQKNQFGLFLAR